MPANTSTLWSKISSIRATPGNIPIGQIYESTDLTTQLQLIRLCTSELGVFANITTPKFPANVMRQAERPRDIRAPGRFIVNTSPTDHYPIQQTRMHTFDGVRWESFGPILELDGKASRHQTSRSEATNSNSISLNHGEWS